MDTNQHNHTPQTYNFKAETQQILDILIHSLYKEREIFIRELISNASDALTRMNFEMLTNREVEDPQTELGIWVKANKGERLLTIQDTGIGMTQDELSENLGTIAKSGARDFINAMKDQQSDLSSIIGKFGVGFYSAFMVAEWIKVDSKSFKPGESSYQWFSTGSNTFSISKSDKKDRGTLVTIKIKEDATEFLEEYNLRSIIKRHSDYIPYPIYLGESKEQVNQQTAIWRKQIKEVKKEEYHNYYRQLTLDSQDPISYTHMIVDAPVQLYAVLFIPSSPERQVFSSRREDGLKLFARNVLIQEYCKDLLPEYLRFIQGVVDSEDLPLNVSRETIQASRTIAQLKKLVTNKVFDLLKDMSSSKPEDYIKFWVKYGGFLKEGIAVDFENKATIAPLLRFHTLNHPNDWISLDQYLENKKSEQTKIYYLSGPDQESLLHSPHLDLFRYHGYDVILLSEPIDSFMILGLTDYKEVAFANAATEKLPEKPINTGENTEKDINPADLEEVIRRFKACLGDKVIDVQSSNQMIDSPARLVVSSGAPSPDLERVYRMLGKDIKETPRTLEINPRHPIIKKLRTIDVKNPLNSMIIEQIFENALLHEGLHPNPANMVQRIQNLIEAALQ